MTGPSPIQVTLIRALSKNGSLQPAPYRRRRFSAALYLIRFEQGSPSQVTKK